MQIQNELGDIAKDVGEGLNWMLKEVWESEADRYGSAVAAECQQLGCFMFLVEFQDNTSLFEFQELADREGKSSKRREEGQT